MWPRIKRYSRPTRAFTGVFAGSWSASRLYTPVVMFLKVDPDQRRSNTLRGAEAFSCRTDARWASVAGEKQVPLEGRDTMSIVLKPEQQRVIDLAVRSGAYRNPAEVLDQAFEIIREQLDLEAWMFDQRDAIAAHIETGF